MSDRERETDAVDASITERRRWMKTVSDEETTVILAAALGEVITRLVKKTVAAELKKHGIGAGSSRATNPHVYLIQSEAGGPIKIGVAKDPEKRLRDLQRTCPHPLRILRLLDGGFTLERDLHERFAEWRLHGEWFSEDCADLVALATDGLDALGVALGRREARVG